MSNASDFVIKNGILEYYQGSEEHLVIPDGTKIISEDAFRETEELKSVKLPESVMKICKYAFEDCTSLERINIPEKVNTIDDYAFRGCEKIREISFSGKPKKIGLLAFWECWKLLDNPENLVPDVLDFLIRMKEGKLTLEEAKELYKISKSQGKFAVKEFENLCMMAWDGKKYPYVFTGIEKTLIIPESINGIPVIKAPIKNVPEDAIVYCNAEFYDKLPRCNKAILAAHWLMDDKMIREEIFESIQKFIKKYPEDVAYALESSNDSAAYQRFIDIAKPKAELIEKLVDECREKPEVLTVLLNSNTPPNKKETAFSLDEKPKITVAELKKLWTYQTLTDGDTGEKFIQITNYKGHEKNITVPGYIGKTAVKEINGVFPAQTETVSFETDDIIIKCSFRNCHSMADENGFISVKVGNRCVLTDYIGEDKEVLVIPEGITENTSGTFSEMNIREAIIPEGFTKLAFSSFGDCPRLQKVLLPESLRSIDTMAFQDCPALKQLYIPKNVESISCLDMHRNDLFIYGEKGSAAYEYATKTDSVFIEGRPQETPIPDFIVKNGVLTSYIGNSGDIEIPADVEEIGSFAFNDNDIICSVTMGDNVRVIREYAFADCHNFSKVKISGSVGTIENNAFQFSNLKHVEIEDGLKTIGEQAFGYLSPFGSTVKIPASVHLIGKDAFYSNFNTTTLYVKAGSYAETYAKENNIPFVAE